MTIRRLFLALLASAGFAYAASAPAQDVNTPSTDAEESQQPSASYSDNELRSFAGAALEVQRIKDAYTPLLAMAATREERQQLMVAASGDMVRALQEQGISVDRFQQILASAQNDPDLVERINFHLNQPR